MSDASDDALLIDGSAGTAYSNSIQLNNFKTNVGDITGAHTDIGINIHAVGGGLAGSFQAINATADADILEASTKWANIDGGDLANWLAGGCSVLKAPYSHIRVKLTSGKCKIALSSNIPFFS